MTLGSAAGRTALRARSADRSLHQRRAILKPLAFVHGSRMLRRSSGALRGRQSSELTFQRAWPSLEVFIRALTKASKAISPERLSPSSWPGTMSIAFAPTAAAAATRHRGYSPYACRANQRRQRVLVNTGTARDGA